MRRRQAMLRVVRRQPARLLRLPVNAMSDGRKQHQMRASNKLIFRLERPFSVNRDLLRVRSRQKTVMSTSLVFRLERQ